MLFAIAQVKFVDERLGPAGFVWGKFVRKRFTANLGRLPILVADGVEIGQSRAIERFVAEKVGLMGKDELERAVIDAVCEHQRDCRESYGKVDGMKKGAEKTAKYKEWFETTFPEFMADVEKALPEGPGPFLVGSTFSSELRVTVTCLIRITRKRASSNRDCTFTGMCR